MTSNLFPGMDPFLERRWRSIHHRLITYVADQLQSGVPETYRVEIRKRIDEVMEFATR